MRLAQLHYFIKVVDVDGVNAAARDLHISQPTVTVAIRELEEELGTALFRRVKQRLVLTEEGRFFYNRLVPILASLQAVTEETRDLGQHRNFVRLGVPPMIGLFLIPRILSAFNQTYPDIEVKIVEASTDELASLLVEGLVDMALMIGESRYNVGFEQYELFHTRYAFYVGREHPLAGRMQVDLRELVREPLILFDKGLYLNQFITQAFQREGLTPHVVLTTSQINTIKEFVSQSAASTFLIRECVEERDQLVEVPTDPAPNITIVAAWEKGQMLGSSLLKLLKLMQKWGHV